MNTIILNNLIIFCYTDLYANVDSFEDRKRLMLPNIRRHQKTIYWGAFPIFTFTFFSKHFCVSSLFLLSLHFFPFGCINKDIFWMNSCVCLSYFYQVLSSHKRLPQSWKGVEKRFIFFVCIFKSMCVCMSPKTHVREFQFPLKCVCIFPIPTSIVTLWNIKNAMK